MSMLRRLSSVLLAKYPSRRPTPFPFVRTPSKASPVCHFISPLSTAVDVAPLPPPHFAGNDVPPPTPELPSSPSESETSSSSAHISNLDDGTFASAAPLQDLFVKCLQSQIDSLRGQLEEQKVLINSMLQNLNMIKSQDGSAVKASGKVQWLEWSAFLEHLKSSGFLKAEENRRGSKPGSLHADDSAPMKRAIYKFSQVHESIYRSLPEDNIKTIAQYGRVDDDQRAIASLKRLRVHYGLDEEVKQDGVSGSSVIPPKLSDLTRLLFSTVTTSEVGSFPDDVKSSVDKLLSEIVSLSKSERMQQDSHKLSKEEAVKPSVKPEAKSELWECSRCHFKNLDSKNRCVECSRRRPRRTFSVTAEEKDVDIETILDDEAEVKPTSNERQIKKKTHEKKLSDEEENGELEHLESSDELNDSDEDILDEILDSDDSEDEDESDRKTSLSSLFDRKTSSTKQRDDRNDRGRNKPYRSSRGRQQEEDEPRSRYGAKSYVDESDDEEELRPRRFGRGAEENSFRRTERGGNQYARKQGGFRSSGVYNERQSNGRWSDSRSDRRGENGYEERGLRSGGGGGRFSRGGGGGGGGRGRTSKY